jgi:hypothetical protein
MDIIIATIDRKPSYYKCYWGQRYKKNWEKDNNGGFF